jgi:hypothetical protein
VDQHRLLTWITGQEVYRDPSRMNEALSSGAKLLYRGEHVGSRMTPTVLNHVLPETEFVAQGPSVLTRQSFAFLISRPQFPPRTGGISITPPAS